MTFHDIRKKSAKLREGSPTAGALKSWVDLLAWSPAPKGKRSRVFPKEGEDQGECSVAAHVKGCSLFSLPRIPPYAHKGRASLSPDSLWGNPTRGKILSSQQPGQESTLGSLRLHFYESITHLLSMELFLFFFFRDFEKVVVLIESGNYFTSENSPPWESPRKFPLLIKTWWWPIVRAPE